MLLVSGNHEYWTKKIDAIKQTVRGFSVKVLEGTCEMVTVNGQAINICGVDDAEAGEKVMLSQLENACKQADTKIFTVLLAHRPEYINTWLEYDFDLILAGHAHGGQWRIPLFVNGFFSPGQGWFPKYAGGKYDFGQTDFIVSRGLSRESTPASRIFNPPELVIIDIKAKVQQ